MQKEVVRKKAAKITEENRAESAKLKVLYEASNHNLSQAAFGAEFDIGNQGAVWQCLNASGMPISLKAARGFAKGLRCDISDFSPRLAIEAAKNAEFAESETDDYVDVKRVNVALSAGHGSEPEIEELVGHLKFTKSFLRSVGVTGSSARVVDVVGPSMEPTIKDGSVLLVNTNNREPINNVIFALARPTDGLIVKRLVKIGENWFARSDNRDFEDIQIDDGEPITIIGRALWMGSKL
jgi:hypothetical protein